MSEEFPMTDEETATPAPPAADVTPADANAAAARPASGPSQAAPLLMGVKLPIRILLGRTQLCLRDIAQLGSGSVVELDCSPEDPVEIIVNDRVIAQGEVVVVSGNYGVRITKIASHQPDPDREGMTCNLFSLSQNLG
jgi:flagellar motor switch protein FliN/FliY